LRAVGLAVSGLAAFLTVAAMIFLVWLNSGSGKSWAGRVALAQGRRVFPGLDIAHVDGFLPFGVDLEDVRVKEPSGRVAVSAHRIHVALDIPALLTGKVQLEEVTVVGPTVHLARDPAGGWNLAHLSAKPARIISIKNLRVSQGRMVLDLPGGSSAELDELALEGSLSRDVSPGSLAADVRRLTFESRVRGKRAKVDARASALLGQEVRASMEAQVSGLSPSGPFPVSLHARGPRRDVRAELRVGRGITASAHIDAERLGYDVLVTLEKLNPRELFAGLPTGDVDLTLHVRGNGIPLHAGSHLFADASSSRIDIGGSRLRTVRALFAGSGPRWSLEELRAKGPGISVLAHGRGDAESFHFAADVDAPRFAARAVRARGKADLYIEGQKGVIALRGRADIRALDVGKLHLRDLVARLAGHTRRGVLELDGRLALAALEEPAHLWARIPLRGRLVPDRDRPIAARFDWKKVPLAALGRLAGSRAPVTGDLFASARLSGSLRAPRLRGEVLVRRGRYAALCDIAARARLNLEKRSTRLTARASLCGKPLLTLRAVMGGGFAELRRPGALEALPISAEARIPAVDPETLAPLLPALRSFHGRVTAEVRGRGTLGEHTAVLRANLTTTRPKGHVVRGLARLVAHVTKGRTRLRGMIRVGNAPLLRVVASAPSTPLELLRTPAGRRRPRFAARCTVGPFPAQLAGAFFPGLQPIAGRLEGKLEVGGAGTALRAKGSLHMDALRILGIDVGSLRARTELSPHRAVALASLTQAKGEARLVARMGPRGGLRATLRAKDLDLSLLQALQPDSPLADARVSAEATATGEVSARSGPGALLLERLLHPKKIAGRLRFEDAQLALYLSRPEKAPRKAAEIKPQKVKRALEEGPPFLLERLEMVRSRLRLVDGTKGRRPALDLEDVALTLENFASRRALIKGVPTVLGLRARMERSGEITAFATFDPLASPPLAAGQAEIRGLHLADLNDFLEASLGAKATQGTLQCNVVFWIAGTALRGSVKTVIDNPEIDPAKSTGWLRSMGIRFLNAAAELVKDEVPGRHAIAAVLPIRGTLNRPDVQILPAVLSVLRNAFVIGIAPGFSGLPLRAAPEPESLFSQAVNALREKRAPKPQPTRKPK
jgi:hypothetical protein